MRYLYSIGIRLYYLAALVVSPWNAKAAKWISGRRGWRKRTRGLFRPDDSLIWFHCASLGEFEQGRPLIEQLRQDYPDYRVLLTFFSPSGYEKRKHYKLADEVMYMPLDTARNARDFIGSIPIELAVFIKYEFWYWHLRELYRRGIPLYLASGSFTGDHLFFRSYGRWYRKVLRYFTHLFVQDQCSLELLQGIGVKHVSIAGDTRFDRVIAAAEEPDRFPCMGSFASGKPVIVAGSTWEKDEQLLAQAFNKLGDRCRWVIAPHEIDDRHIDRLKRWFPGAVLFSEVMDRADAGSDVIIVDSIGHLLSLYSYGTVAFVGGGFGKGIHNLLEPAVHGLPVIFGPNADRFREAAEIVELEAGHRIAVDTDLAELLKTYLDNPRLLKEAGSRLESYFEAHAGAAVRITTGIFSQNINIPRPGVD